MFRVESSPFFILDGKNHVYNKGENIDKFLKPIEHDYPNWLSMYRIIENYNRYSD